MAATDMSAGVLESQPPRFSPEEIAAIAEERFGLRGTAVDLGSERDQTFLIDDGSDGGVLKVSNLGERAEVLDLEAEAILHARRADPALPVARPLVAAPGASGSAAYRTTVQGPDGTHHVRLFERLPGRAGDREIGDGAVRAYAATNARLNRALRAFFHPAAGRELLWDLKHFARLRPLVACLAHPERRRLVEIVLDRYEERVLPRWPELPAQVVHDDFTLDNVLLDERERVSGIVDLGDIAHTAQVADFAIGLASLLRGRRAEDVFRIARLAVDGFQSVAPFEPAELEVLSDLVAGRLATIVIISAWRVARYPENAEYIQAADAASWALLEQFDATGWDAVARELGAAAPPVDSAALAARREAALGPALTDLSYGRPVHLVRGEGAWLFEADGRRLLDAYNNVPVVGHCHPRVTEAVVRQTRTLNTHSRYLYEPLIELGERLIASMPPAAGLDTVMVVNSGSEANDIAWRLAVAATGNRGAIVTEHAYHGVTAAIADLSPEEWPPGIAPAAVERIAPPPAADLKGAVERLAQRGHGLAATYLDGAFTSDGIHFPEPEEIQALVRATRAAGGLFVADEVQAGHGRTGEHLWSFQRYGIAPDFVTLGKPMGNGYPVAALLTRSEIAAALGADLFSTFGGNPVAARAALAVLDVIEDERLVENAARVGARLLAGLHTLGAGHPAVVAVRGRGLLAGVELADAELARTVVDRLREDGVLIGRTGRADEVLKIRPPLVFGEEHAETVVEALGRALVDPLND